METFYLTQLPEITQFLLGQVGSSCVAPSWWQVLIITGLVAASGIALITTGVGIVGIATILIEMVIAGASIETTASALGIHFSVAGGALEILVNLIMAIRGILGC